MIGLHDHAQDQIPVAGLPHKASVCSINSGGRLDLLMTSLRRELLICEISIPMRWRDWKQPCGVPTMKRNACALFNQLSQLLRTQYNMPFVRSNCVAYFAADAAFFFKRGKQRSDYEQALPDLVKFYEAIRKMSDLPFDPQRAARWNWNGGSFTVSVPRIRRRIWMSPWLIYRSSSTRCHASA